MAGGSAALAPGRARARARAGQRGRVGLERTGNGRGRPAHPRRLDGAVREPARARRPGRAGTDHRHRPAHPRHGGARPPVRHRPRRLHRDAQRPPRRRPRAGARLDELPPPAALPDVRRHRPGPSKATTNSRCCSATGGSAAGSAGATGAPSTGIGWRCSRSWRSRPADGAVHVLATDETWTARESGVLADDLYDGQRTDLRPRRGDRSDPVEAIEATLPRLVAPDGPPVRATETLPARDVFRSPSGATLVDFGQNLVGWVRLTVRGAEPGTEVTIRHAEVLEDGELGVRPLRTAKATDSYILAGGVEVLEPSLTFHGFRYAEVSGLDEVRHEDVEAVVVGSDLRRTGWFSSSDERARPVPRERGLEHARQLPRRADRLPAARRAARLDRRHPGVLPGGDVPVRRDRVPQLVAGRPRGRAARGRLGAVRDPRRARQPGRGRRRLGRRRDARAVGRLPAQRRPRAARPPAARACAPGSTAPPRWPARTTCGPAASSSATGSTRRRRRTPPPTRRPTRTWSPPPIWRARPRSSRSPPRWSASSTSRDRYARLADRVRGAFAREYVTVGGRVLSDAATVYALALEWSLLPTEEQRRHAGERLADLVRTAGFRISTGFLGTPLIADALTSTGHADVAYRLLLQTGCPSWLYAVTMGATTVWERWDSLLADGVDQPRRDDVVQPLRARRGGRLAAPDRGRAGSRSARLPAAGRQARAVALPDERAGPAANAVRGRRGRRGNGPTGCSSCG